MFVHSIMYGYFAFSSELKRITWFTPMYITILQIIQMCMGLAISLLYMINENTKYDTQTLLQVSYTFIMYSSYLYLFCKLFQSKYILLHNQSKSPVPRHLVLRSRCSLWSWHIRFHQLLAEKICRPLLGLRIEII